MQAGGVCLAVRLCMCVPARRRWEGQLRSCLPVLPRPQQLLCCAARRTRPSLLQLPPPLLDPCAKAGGCE